MVKSVLKNIYEKKYKVLLIIPFLMLMLAVGQIIFQTGTTGDFINKGVSLKGGITLTVNKVADISDIKSNLLNAFPQADINVRALSQTGTQVGVLIEASDIESDELLNQVKSYFGELKTKDYSIESMGSSLGESFFRETFKALIMAFLFMGLVVFLYFSESIMSKLIATVLSLFAILLVYAASSIILYIVAALFVIALFVTYIKYSIPSVAVILAAFSDIIVTMSIVNLTGMKLSTAGVAAFLMLIGYSVDTDILLSTKVLKRKGGKVVDRIYSAMSTGITMSITTLVALVVAIMFTQSDVLKQIMIILIIGLVVDLVNTWIQNAGIIRLYLEKKGRE